MSLMITYAEKMILETRNAWFDKLSFSQLEARHFFLIVVQISFCPTSFVFFCHEWFFSIHVQPRSQRFIRLRGLYSGGSRPSDKKGRGGGGKAVSKNFFWPLGPQFGLKIMEGPGSATALTISIEFCFQLLYCNDPTSSKYSNNPRVTTFNFWSKTKKLLVIWGCYGLSRF